MQAGNRACDASFSGSAVASGGSCTFLDAKWFIHTVGVKEAPEQSTLSGSGIGKKK